MLLCFVVKKQLFDTRTPPPPPTASVYQPTTNQQSILAHSHDRAQNDNRPYHCAKNEYIDGQFLAGDCGSRQRQVADGADVLFTDTIFYTHPVLSTYRVTTLG